MAKNTSTGTTKKAATKKAKTPVEVSPVSEWKKPIEPMELPSGKFMKIRRVSFETFMKAGIIPNSLMAIVQDGIDRGGSVDDVDEDLKKFMDDPSQIADLFQLMDEVTIFCAVEPRVFRLPMKADTEDNGKQIVDEEKRRDDRLYVDELDQDDKVFIFNLSQGGTDDVAQFRAEQADSVASVPGLSVVGRSAE